jgi:hypothetical protein
MGEISATLVERIDEAAGDKFANETRFDDTRRRIASFVRN